MAEGAPSRKRAFAEEESAAQQQKKVRFPKGKKAKIGDYVVDDASVEVVPGWRDPRLAANERAMARTQLTAELLEEGGEMLQDVSRAEIQYESNETFVDDGVPMEPFNLTQEREEGYFDADGNYVEYITEDIKDAWLDSIEANRNIAPTNNAAEPPKNKKEDDVELSSGNVAEIKRRIADVLEPGETVLQALRRLKGNSNDRKVKMSEETKHVFDQLTEDAMHLLENGEYNVYDEKQETFLREAEGYEKLAEARKQAFTSSTVVDNNTSEDAFDMFADEDGSADATITPAPSDTNDAASNTANHQASDSDYVYDETSGYYYSNSLGYYYDPSSGLYCYASTGQWYSYNEDSGAYEEWQQQEAAASAVSI